MNMEAPETESRDLNELLADIDHDILLAAEEVDTTLIDWLLSLSPLERISWTTRIAATIGGLRRVQN